MDTELKQAMQDLVDQQPPMRGTPTDDVQRGRRSVVGRRVGAGLATLVCAGVAFAGVTALTSDQEPGAGPVVATPSEASILERCQEMGASALDSHWGSGDRVLTSAASGGEVRAVIESSDGDRWADCWLENDRGNGNFTVYAMHETKDPTVEFGYTGGADVGRFSMAERFPADVARVELTFGNGEARSAEAVDGFVVFKLDDLGAGADLEAIRLYDADGSFLAGPENAPGDASLPRDYRTLVGEPLAFAGEAANL